jgi:multimeric flavodoxin WrbA
MERKLIMKKVTAFVGSAHRKNTHKAVVQFLENLEALGDVECEIVTLSKYDLGICRGCRLCFERGEEYCPSKVLTVSSSQHPTTASRYQDL